MTQEKKPPRRTPFKGFTNGRYAGGRHKPGVMNKLEKRYAAHLDQRLNAGKIVGWWFEPMRLKYGSDQKATYLPDFAILYPDGSLYFVDTKGFIDPKSVVKAKACADKYFMFRFWFAKPRTKKNGGGWEYTEF